MNPDICRERVTGKLEHIQNFKGQRRVSFKALVPYLLRSSPIEELSFLLQVANGAQELNLAMGLNLSLKFKNTWVLWKQDWI